MAGTIHIRSDYGEQVIDSCAGLLDRLTVIEAKCLGATPILVVIERASTGYLKVGLGSSKSVLEFVPASLDPPYFASVGDPTAAGSMIFRFEGEHTEIPARHLIPRELALAAARRFCSAGDLLQEVRWEPQ